MKRTCLLVGILMILAALVLSSYGLAAAETCDATGCTWTVSWTEPTLLQGGGALTNLTKTTLTMTVGAGTPVTLDVAATKATGGGAVSATSPKALIAPGSKAAVTFTVTATNPYGTSPASPADAFTKDRSAELPPAALTAPTHQ